MNIEYNLSTHRSTVFVVPRNEYNYCTSETCPPTLTVILSDQFRSVDPSYQCKQAMETKNGCRRVTVEFFFLDTLLPAISAQGILGSSHASRNKDASSHAHQTEKVEASAEAILSLAKTHPPAACSANHHSAHFGTVSAPSTNSRLPIAAPRPIPW